MTVADRVPDMKEAMERLETAIRARGPMVVACSAASTRDCSHTSPTAFLDGRMLCVLGVSASLAESERLDALAFFEKQGLPYEFVATHEVDNPEYRANGPDRCIPLQARALYANGIRAGGAQCSGARVRRQRR
jgi:uncharacterized protein